ncbi:hypothetical protein IWX49DRAFT_568094 [Phyllosticta citricarpa]|uniref:Uncharacterized protein n=2 Tax=Phyllosticta TaxID=121621 RepID=A0ABR1MHL0_9PEZI
MSLHRSFRPRPPFFVFSFMYIHDLCLLEHTYVNLLLRPLTQRVYTRGLLPLHTYMVVLAFLFRT